MPGRDGKFTEEEMRDPLARILGPINDYIAETRFGRAAQEFENTLVDKAKAMKGPDRGGFLGRLMEAAKKNGNTIYEELQGGTILDKVRANLAELEPIAADTLKGSKKDLDHLVNLISPAGDASPGVHTIEDTIDNIIFDPTSELAPLQLVGMGAATASAAGVKAVVRGAKKLGWNALNYINRGSKAAKVTQGGMRVSPTEVARLAPKVTKVKAKVAEALPHVSGEASPESVHRLASGAKYYRVKPGGVVSDVIAGAEDEAIRTANKTRDAIVRVSPNKDQVIESLGRVSKAQNDAILKLKPGAVRTLGKTKTVTLDLAKKADDKDFLSKLGVKPGRGKKP